jgi:hypothetical protein
MWDDEQIDAAIDESARQMTAGEPGGDFRARLMARIDAESGFSAAGFARRSWRPALAGLSLAALIVIVLAVSRDRQPPASRVASAPASTVRQPEPDSMSAVRLPPSPPRGFGGPRKPDPTHDDGDDLRDVESLDLPSIDLDSIAVTSLAAGDSIHIDPLPPVPSIAVTPLDVENEGDRR